MSITPASYFNYNSTPFMQGLTSSDYSFEGQSQNSNGGFGLNRYLKGDSNSNNLFGSNNRASGMGFNPNRTLFTSNRGAPTADILGYEPTKSPVMPQQFKIQDAHDAIDASAPALMPGDGGIGDATAMKQISDVKDNLTQIANSPNPDAMAQSLMSQPGYGSNSFGGGLTMMGLSIMSGADPLQAAQAGLQGQDYFDEKDRKARTSDYLRQNARQLLDAGYSPDSISAAITNGDNSLLKMRQLSPEEKRKQELQDKQTDFEQRKELQKAGFEQQYKMTDINAQHAEERQQAAIEANQQKQEAAEKQKQATLNSKYWVDPESNKPLITNTEYNRYNSNFSKQHSALGVKASAFHQAETNLQDARDFKASGDDISSRASYRQSLEQYVKGVMGTGTRALDDQQLKHLGADPSWIANKTGELKLAAGFSPTDDNIKYIQASIDTDGKASRNEANNLMKNEIDRLVKTRGLSIPEATRLANSYASTTLGSDTYDPYGVFGEPTGSVEEKPKVSADQGAVGSANTTGKQSKQYKGAANAAAQALAGK
jgi:hypothetical protein